MSISGKIFERLIHSLAGELYGYAFSLCRDRHAAEDLVQETCLRAWKSHKKLRDPDAARAWLYTILKREHARLYQKEKAAKEQELTGEFSSSTGYDTSTEAWVLRRALSQLPKMYREPLMLQITAGFSGKEIGQILNLTQANVLARVSRARRMLRESLSDEVKLVYAGESKQ